MNPTRGLAVVLSVTILSAIPVARSEAQPYDMYQYWLMPHGLRGVMQTDLWPLKKDKVKTRDAKTCLFLFGPKGPFPILAPGKSGRAIGEHAFWRGSMWGQTVALQGDSSFTKYDLFVDAGGQLHYWGTFRGNGYYDSEESHSFSSPFVWMDQFMNVGDFKQQLITDSLMDPQLRKSANVADNTLRVEVMAHYATWQDPDSQITYNDVIEMHYWGRYPDEASKEVYHLGNGLGTIRFETSNSGEPSGIQKQYALYFENFTPPSEAEVPWFDPFKNTTFVHNGYFEDFLVPPADGGAVAAYVRDWAGSSPDAVITTTAGDEGTGPWQVALRGSTGGGDANADWINSSNWIPVTPGRTYRLSGSVWRVSANDRVYLDFSDGQGQGGSFPDAEAYATGTNVWERVAAEATVGAGITAINVRCVRDGANEGNAYCDGITLQRID